MANRYLGQPTKVSRIHDVITQSVTPLVTQTEVREAMRKKGVKCSESQIYQVRQVLGLTNTPLSTAGASTRRTTTATIPSPPVPASTPTTGTTQTLPRAITTMSKLGMGEKYENMKKVLAWSKSELGGFQTLREIVQEIGSLADAL